MPRKALSAGLTQNVLGQLPTLGTGAEGGSALQDKRRNGAHGPEKALQGCASMRRNVLACPPVLTPSHSGRSLPKASRD